MWRIACIEVKYNRPRLLYPLIRWNDRSELFFQAGARRRTGRAGPGLRASSSLGHGGQSSCPGWRPTCRWPWGTQQCCPVGLPTSGADRWVPKIGSAEIICTTISYGYPILQADNIKLYTHSWCLNSMKCQNVTLYGQSENDFSLERGECMIPSEYGNETLLR